MNNPKLLPIAFANSGLKNPIEINTPPTERSATLDAGFPESTMKPISEGGLPPSGKDLNGILYDISDNVSFLAKGGQYKYDQSFADEIGGYEIGAKLLLDNGNTVVSTMPNNTTNPNISMIGWDFYVKDSWVKTWSGRTQDSKNKDSVSALDFGIVPDSTLDQTVKFDNFLNYLRSNKVKGIVPAGTYILSPTKTRTFGSEVVSYCLDISGVDLEGALRGYRNANGAILKMSPLNTDPNAVMMLQAQQSADVLMYELRGFAFRDCPVCLRMTYAVHCDIDHVYFDSSCRDGIILGEFSFLSGPLFNRFNNVNCAVSGKPLQLRGQQWCNANMFENFYLSGGEPSSINVTGGYGALANMFIGGEFASTASGSHGMIIGRASSTSFIGTYFEPQGHAIVFDGLSRQTRLVNCTYGTTNNTKTEGVNPSILYHRASFNASVYVDGGSLFFGDSATQNNMRFIESANPSGLSVYMTTQPSLGGGNFNYLVFSPELFRGMGTFNGTYQTVGSSIEFGAAGASITGLPSTSVITTTVSGRICTVQCRLDYSTSAVYGDGVYYIRLPRNPVNSNSISRGSLAGYKVSGANEQYVGTCGATGVGNLTMQLSRPTATSTYDDVAKTVTTTIRPRLIDVNKQEMENLGSGGYISLSLTYAI